MRTDSAAVRALRAGGVPVQHTIERAVAALGHATRLGATSHGVVLHEATAAVPFEPGYLAARELLSFVDFPRAHVVTSAADAKATTLRPPYALKAGWLAHKSEHGGVRLNLTDPATAFEEMEARLGPGTYVLEEMDTREHTVELIVGAKRDHSFGPVVLVGAGGVHAELFKDTAIELAPVTPATARDMLARLVSAPLLSGWRGAEPVDVAALAQVIAHVSETLVARPDLAEIELNPVRVGPGGVLAVDALIIPSEDAVNDTAGRHVA